MIRKDEDTFTRTRVLLVVGAAGGVEKGQADRISVNFRYPFPKKSPQHGRYTVIPRLTKIIRSGITFVSRNVISRRFL